MITSTANSRIKQARKLQQTRYRRQRNQLLLEGVRLVEDAWRAGVRPSVLFIDPVRLRSNARVVALVTEMSAVGVELVECAPDVFASLSETVTPQGVAAIVPWPELAAPPAPTLVLVLDGVRDPGNAGTLLRTGEAAGVDLAIFGPETVDPFNDKVVRAAMGAHFRLPLRRCAGWEEVGTYVSTVGPIYVAEASGATTYDQVDWRTPAVLVVGGEATGASAPARIHAAPIAIPMLGSTESLNAAVAGAVILFEAARQRRQA